MELAHLAKLLFYIGKNRILDKDEENYLSASVGMIAEEIAYLQHTTKTKVANQIRDTLNQGHKSRKHKTA